MGECCLVSLTWLTLANVTLVQRGSGENIGAAISRHVPVYINMQNYQVPGPDPDRTRMDTLRTAVISSSFPSIALIEVELRILFTFTIHEHWAIYARSAVHSLGLYRSIGFSLFLLTPLLLYDSRGDAGNSHTVAKGLRHHGACSHNYIVSQGHPGQNDGPTAYPAAAPDAHRLPALPASLTAARGLAGVLGSDDLHRLFRFGRLSRFGTPMRIP